MRFKSLLALALIGAMGFSQPVQAKMDTEVTSSFKSAAAPLDLASAVDGKHVFVLSKGKVAIYTRDGKLKDTITVDPSFDQLSVSGLSLANLDEKIFLSSSQTGTVQEISYSFIVNIDTSDAPFLGAAAAPVTIAVFSDFQ